MTMITKFSVVMPIHNEESFLPLSLPSILRLHPDEIILLFDRCTDHSYSIASKILSENSCNVQMIELKKLANWGYMHAYVSRLGYSQAQNDLILATAADIILDPKIPSYFSLIGTKNIAFVSFLHIDYPISFRNLLKRLLVGIGLLPPSQKERWLAGPYIFSKKAWKETEDQTSVKKVKRAHDTHLHKAILTKYSSRCIVTNTVHLRPRENACMHYLRGQLYWTVAKRSFIITLLSALFYLRLGLVKGYIHARMGVKS